MSWLSQYRGLARYNQWMNEKLYAAAGQLSDEERKLDRGAFFKSIHRTLNHLVLTDSIWLLRFTGDERHFPCTAQGRIIPLTGLAQELYADFAELSRQRAKLDETILAWVSTLDESALKKDITYRTTTGESFTHALWLALGHMFNHQTHHRGQITTLMLQASVDPGVTDLIVLLRSELNALG